MKNIYKPSVIDAFLAKAETDSSFTRELVSYLGHAGYKFTRVWRWHGNNFKRMGIVHVQYGSEFIYKTEFLMGATVRIPATYRVGSRHHRAFLRALAFVFAHAREHAIPLRLEFFQIPGKSDSSATLHDSSLTSANSPTLHILSAENSVS